MSWQGLGHEAKQQVRSNRLFFGTALILIALLILLAFFLVRPKRSADEPVTEQIGIEDTHSEEVFSQLLQLRQEAAELQKLIAEKRAPRKAPEEMVTVRRSNSFIAVPVGDAFQEIKKVDSQVYIPSGSVFRARLLMPIKTSVQETFVMAQTTHEYRMDSRRRIPRGTRLIGTARLNPMLRGVIVQFNKLVSPQGKEHAVNLLALSHDLFPELDGIYFSNEVETYSTIMAFGFLGGLAEASRPRDRTIIGPVPSEDLAGNLLHGASTASFRVMEEVLRDIRERAVEYVIVPAGEPVFLVFRERFTGDIR
jgi:hypothetical protein